MFEPQDNDWIHIRAGDQLTGGELVPISDVMNAEWIGVVGRDRQLVHYAWDLYQVHFGEEATPSWLARATEQSMETVESVIKDIRRNKNLFIRPPMSCDLTKKLEGMMDEYMRGWGAVHA